MEKIGVGYASVTETEKRYVLEALDNQRISQSIFVTRFEKKFAQMHDCQYGVMCNSGTSALHLALETLKEIDLWDNKTEILCPAITFIATSNACIHAGLKVKFVDVEFNTYNMNPDEIEKHITPNTRCIIPVHTFGMPCRMNKIMEIANRYNLRVIEDCAEAHFATTGGEKVGGFGDISVFSTYVAHTITTGIGGVVCTKNRDMMEIIRSLVAHGRACTCEKCMASDSDKVCPKRMDTEIDKRFMFVRLGYSYRVGEIEGALGLAQLERKDDIMNARRDNAKYLIENLQGFEDRIQLPRHPVAVEHTYMMFPILIKDRVSLIRDDFTRYLESQNIETRPMLPLLNQPVYKKIFGNIETDYPVAMYIDQNGFYIGCHHGLEKKHLDYIVVAIKNYLQNHKKKA